jgi:hypothetical protein
MQTNLVPQRFNMLIFLCMNHVWYKSISEFLEIKREEACPGNLTCQFTNVSWFQTRYSVHFILLSCEYYCLLVRCHSLFGLSPIHCYKYNVFGHYPSSCLELNPSCLYFKHNVLETGFCLRLKVKPTLLGPIDRTSPYLRTPVLASRWGT